MSLELSDKGFRGALVKNSQFYFKYALLIKYVLIKNSFFYVFDYSLKWVNSDNITRSKAPNVRSKYS